MSASTSRTDPLAARVGLAIATALVLVFLYVPLAIILLYAFNPARSQA